MFKEQIKHSDINQLPKIIGATIQQVSKTIGEAHTRTFLDHLEKWEEYYIEQGSPENHFELRYHIEKFAAKILGKPSKKIVLKSAPIEGLQYQGKDFLTLLQKVTNRRIVFDPNFAVYGGIARAALKLLAGVNADGEFPLSDADVIANYSPELETVCKMYGIDLAGTKIVSGNMMDEIHYVLANTVDCTLNQAVIYNRRIYYSDAAMEDVKTGTVRIVPKNDPLFGTEGIYLPEGEVYLLKNGFYRALSYLVRNKATNVIVSEENIEQERFEIGRYWLVLLFVKILPMENRLARNLAITNWYRIARELGSTETTHPVKFLNELLAAYPGMEHLMNKKKNSTTDSQLHWLVTKLTDTIIERTLDNKTDKYPTTFTPKTLVAPSKEVVVHIKTFWDLVKTLNKTIPA